MATTAASFVVVQSEHEAESQAVLPTAFLEDASLRRRAVPSNRPIREVIDALQRETSSFGVQEVELRANGRVLDLDEVLPAGQIVQMRTRWCVPLLAN
jgi:hypothetical protein